MKSWWALPLIFLASTTTKNGYTMENDIHTIKHQHEAKLLALSGVVSVGIGLNQEKQPAIIIGIEREDEELRRQLPTQLDGIPVIVRIVGTVKAQ